MLIVQGLTKEYESPAGPLRVLNGVDLQLDAGSAISIMGPSGSGKSTLLSILGALETPTAGKVTVDGENPFSASDPELAAFRNRKVGFVFQDHCLLPQCNVLENVLIPTLAGAPAPEAPERARELLERVGLSQRLDHLPSQLSGGEKQRVAIARALIRRPSLLLCDEPTGNLDRVSSESVARLLLELEERAKMVVVIVTHSDKLGARTPRRFELLDGKLVERN